MGSAKCACAVSPWWLYVGLRGWMAVLVEEVGGYTTNGARVRSL